MQETGDSSRLLHFRRNMNVKCQKSLDIISGSCLYSLFQHLYRMLSHHFCRKW